MNTIHLWQDRIEMMQTHIRPHRSVLNVSDIAVDSGFSTNTVRAWIVEGRSVPGRRGRVKLMIIDGISDGPYRMRWETYREFLSQFPDVQC